jgi:hypothetical protein
MFCAQNGYQPRTILEIKEAVAAYIESLPGAVATCRGQNTPQTRAQAIYDEYVDPLRGGAPMPPPKIAGAGGVQVNNPAMGPWKQNLIARIDLRVNTLVQTGAQTIQQDIQTARVGHALVSHTAAIPSPADFYQPLVQAGHKFAQAHVLAYIDYLIEAINNYIQHEVNHSNRRKRIRDSAVNVLQAAKANTGFLPNENLDIGIFNKKVPNAVGDANTLDLMAEFWSGQRTGTETRKARFRQACNGVGGQAAQNPNPPHLRRYGSTAEGADIRLQRGFYQKEGVSFEQYKWFLDLSVQNATTSVSDTDSAFFVTLKAGAAAAIHGVEQEYDANDEPPVIHKPNIGGEVGCFGVHEDCLVDFNTRMVHSIQIKNQQSGQFEQPNVTPV